MDKYEFNIKLDQIKKLAAKKDYKSAARIANSMDWRKVKDWSTLATVINVQEAAGYLEEARDTAILAYNRNQGGRRLVYKLTELFIRLRQFDDAEDLYNEYVHMAPRDVSRFILEYKLKKAENAQIGTLIEILEEYKEQEIDEKYMYELAQLYSYANMTDKCVRICDEIILWFSDGEYVDSAIKLKQKYASITATQQKILEEAVRKKDMSDEEHTKELTFAKELEKVRYSDEMENELASEESMNEEQKTTVFNLNSEDADIKKDNPADEDDDDSEYEEENGPSVDLIQNKADENAKSFFKALLSKVEGTKGQEEDVELNESPIPEPDEADREPDENEIQEFVMDGRQDGIEKAKQSLNELIAKARQNIEDSYENVRQQNVEEELARTAQSIEVPVNDYNIYDTRNLQAELAKNLDEIMQQEEALSGTQIKDERDTRSLQPQPKEQQKDQPEVKAVVEPKEEEADEDTQIEGQMSIADWVEAVQEEKYGNRETKEFSKAELERELAERESKEEAYDRLMAKQKEEAIRSGIPFNELQASSNAKQTLFVQSVKTDLAIRTGKAAARMESDVIKQKEDDKIWLFAYKNRANEEEAAASIESAATEENEETEAALRVQEALAKEVMEALSGSAVTEEPDYTEESENSDYVEPDEEYDEMGEEDYEESEDDYDKSEDDYDDAEESDAEQEEYEEYDVEPIEEETPKNVRSLFHFGRKKDRYKEEDEYEEEYEGEPEEEYEEEEPEYDDEDKLEIPKEVRKFFSKYNDMDGVTEQLAEYFAAAGDEIGQRTSATGNIIISGNRSADKANLAKNIARALNQLYPEHPKKIAKTTGESINQKGIAKSLPKLIGTILIVEDAGSIVPKRINELLNVMQQDTGGMLVIIIDSDTEINVLLSVNPELTDAFNHRIIIKQYAVAELVDYARKYAGKRQHVVNDDALTLLYMKINKLSKEKEYVRTDEVKEIIDKAIVKAERRASRRLFGRHVRRGGEYFVLTESDFKD